MLAASPAATADAALSTEVPAGQSRSIRVRALPAGALLAVRIVTSGRLLVALIGAKQLKAPRQDRAPPAEAAAATPRAAPGKSLARQKLARHFTPAGMRLPGLGRRSRTPKVPLAASTVMSTTSTVAV